MKYKIFELVKTGHTSEYDYCNFYRWALEYIDYNGLSENEYIHMNEAIDAIKESSESLTHKKIAIIPVININYKGELS